MKVLWHALVIPLLLMVGAASANKNTLEVRAFPRLQTLDISRGCSPVMFVAEIKGPETEEWYCPSIEWEKPDGTVSKEESDCNTYEARHSCREPQEGCGIRGFKMDPATGRYVDIVKECPCTITGYPRLWRWRVCAPDHPRGEAWTVRVRLTKNGDTVAYQDIEFWVK